jgi:hypothetical protein
VAAAATTGARSRQGTRARRLKTLAAAFAGRIRALGRPAFGRVHRLACRPRPHRIGRPEAPPQRARWGHQLLEYHHRNAAQDWALCMRAGLSRRTWPPRKSAIWSHAGPDVGSPSDSDWSRGRCASRSSLWSATRPPADWLICVPNWRFCAARAKSVIPDPRRFVPPAGAGKLRARIGAAGIAVVHGGVTKVR